MITDGSPNTLTERITMPSEKNPQFSFADEPAPEIKQPHKDLAQQLLDFILRWPKATVSRRDIYIYGPRCLRGRMEAINAAEALVKYGWLRPHKTHRHDWRVWEIIRRPIIHPTIAA